MLLYHTLWFARYIYSAMGGGYLVLNKQLSSGNYIPVQNPLKKPPPIALFTSLLDSPKIPRNAFISSEAYSFTKVACLAC